MPLSIKRGLRYAYTLFLFASLAAIASIFGVNLYRSSRIAILHKELEKCGAKVQYLGSNVPSLK